MYNLMIVEDDYQIRTGLSTFFPWNELGFEVITSFDNGVSALNYIKENKNTHVVLSDIKMPNMDGLELARSIREIQPDTIIIFLTAYRSFDYAQEAVELGILKYIVKSTKYNDLISIFTQIKSDLDNHRVDMTQKLLQNNARNPKFTQKTDEQIIAKILEYINDNLADVTLQSVATHINMNPVYLSRYFKQKTNINFSEYLSKLKMDVAVEQLTTTRMKVSHISELLGYSNEKNFSRAFKKYCGISPINYRRIKN